MSFLREVGETLTLSGIDVPQAVPTRHGDLVVEVSKDQHCDLLTWVDGEVRRPGDGLDIPAVRQLGRALALVHNTADTIAIPPGLPRWDADGMFTTAASPFRPLLDIDEILSPADRADLNEIANRTRAIFGDTDPAFGLIHADYILGNTRLTRKGGEWRIGILDFDDCGMGSYLYDLCPMLGNLAGQPGDTYNADYPVLRDALLSGYRTVRPLPVEWERYLPVLMAARHANHCFWTAGLNVSPTPQRDAAWRMGLARKCLQLPI